MAARKILLIIGGGIAAYKTHELIRGLKKQGDSVQVILTEAGSQFVTPVTVAALSGERVLQHIFASDEDGRFDHIRLSRESDLIVVAPATADLMAKMAQGLAGDLASAVLLATDKPVLLAPAMNVKMWEHPATRRNVATLRGDGLHFIGPNGGELGCGEQGAGRMAEPAEILGAIDTLLVPKTLSGKKALVTAGPTVEPIDPVRFIANRSSGKQGYAIAAALAAAGADTVLVSGPTVLPPPAGVRYIGVETARQMLASCQQELPVDIAVFTAAVADWRPTDAHHQKLKKHGQTPALTLTENPDILRTIAQSTPRPALVVGFAAETENLADFASAKRVAKGCDWILANDVSTPVFGADKNRILLIDAAGEERWPEISKNEVGTRLACRIAKHFQETLS